MSLGPRIFVQVVRAFDDFEEGEKGHESDQEYVLHHTSADDATSGAGDGCQL